MGTTRSLCYGMPRTWWSIVWCSGQRKVHPCYMRALEPYSTVVPGTCMRADTPAHAEQAVVASGMHLLGWRQLACTMHFQHFYKEKHKTHQPRSNVTCPGAELAPSQGCCWLAGVSTSPTFHTCGMVHPLLNIAAIHGLLQRLRPQNNLAQDFYGSKPQSQQTSTIMTLCPAV